MRENNIEMVFNVKCSNPFVFGLCFGYFKDFSKNTCLIGNIKENGERRPIVHHYRSAEITEKMLAN